jgi:chromosome segregation ATPase
MSNLIEIVDSLENKISKLLHKYDLLKQKNNELEEIIEENKSRILKLQTGLESLSQENQTLKSANAILGSNEHKRETKLKINSLIREIDQCIVQLSE